MPHIRTHTAPSPALPVILAMVLAAIASLIAGQAIAQQPEPGSPAAAHQFLSQTLPTASHTQAMEERRVTNGFNSYMEVVWHRIEITRVQSSGCITTLYGQNLRTGRPTTDTIDWSLVSTIAGGGEVVNVRGRHGARRSSYAGTGDVIELFMTDPAMGGRIRNAMRAIQASCDSTANLGF